MLKTFKNLFDQLSASLAPDAPQAHQTTAMHQLQLATAVLLVEVMRAEPNLDPAERAAIVTALRSKFELAEDELERLLELALDTSRSAYDFQHFTALLNERFSQGQKIRVIEDMWQVAYADGHLDVHESHVIRKVAGLMHVTHGEYIAAKMRAEEDAGLR
ncbi:MAG: TerB family tellurite resistance protein [Burkholderiaceae bacterium]